MALKEQITNDTKAALLSGNRFAGETLRNLKAAILNEEVGQNKRDVGLSDAEVEKIIAREIKKRFESAEAFEKGDRQESADQERNEAEILAKYMPKQLSDAELNVVIKAKASELGVADMSGMGKLIGAVKHDVGNKADGGSIAQLVKHHLSR